VNASVVVKGHAGKLVFGNIGKTPVVCIWRLFYVSGRYCVVILYYITLHYYTVLYNPTLLYCIMILNSWLV